MSSTVNEVGSYQQISATTIVQTVPCQLLGIFVSAASATPTITVYDAATAVTTTKVIDTFTPVAATFYRLPVGLGTGLYVVISGTVSCTIVFA